MAIIKRGMWTLHSELELYNDAELEATDNLTKIIYIKPLDSYDLTYYRIEEEYIAEKVDGELNFIIRRNQYDVESGEISYSYEEYNYLYDGWTYDRGSEPARHRTFEEDTEVSEEFADWWFANALLEPTLTVDLRTVGLMPGTYNLTAQSNGEGKVSSPLSDTKEYTTDLEQLPTPTISIEDGSLIITNFGEADTILLYANNKPAKRFTSENDIYGEEVYFRLPMLILPRGTSTFYVQAHSKNYRSSEYSNVASWTPDEPNPITFKIPDNYTMITNPTEIGYGEIAIAEYQSPNPAYSEKFITLNNIEVDTGGELGGWGESATTPVPLMAFYNASGPAEVEIGTASIGTTLSYDLTKIYSATDHAYTFEKGTWSGELRSTNYTQSNTTAGVKLTFTLPRATDVKITYRRDGWYMYNSIQFSQIDSSAIYISHTPAPEETITYTNVPAGEHYIIVTHVTGSWQSTYNSGSVTLESMYAVYNYEEGVSDYMYPITWDIPEQYFDIRRCSTKILYPQTLYEGQISKDPNMPRMECEVTGADARFSCTLVGDDDWTTRPSISLTLSNATGPVHVVIREKEE